MTISGKRYKPDVKGLDRAKYRTTGLWSEVGDQILALSVRIEVWEPEFNPPEPLAFELPDGARVTSGTLLVSKTERKRNPVRGLAFPIVTPLQLNTKWITVHLHGENGILVPFRPMKTCICSIQGLILKDTFGDDIVRGNQ